MTQFLKRLGYQREKTEEEEEGGTRETKKRRQKGGVGGRGRGGREGGEKSRSVLDIPSVSFTVSPILDATISPQNSLTSVFREVPTCAYKFFHVHRHERNISTPFSYL